ncbi:MAG TPA: DUF433 domain-containing protein [Candidatus Kapabacteria bacterium]|nr:DUF433 domain-containing protein [Candidatus Kapabacteria bacterium]
MASQSKYIVSDPEVMSGASVFVGSRVPFAYLMEYLERGSTVENFSEDYPSVSVERATKALEEASILVEEAVHAYSGLSR